MNRIWAVVIFLFIPALAFCQLSVSPSAPQQNNYIYVNGSILYVQGSIDLKKNSGPEEMANLYLRADGQLIQGERGTTGNSGSGFISVYQEGTSNAYDYNYWASPVGTPVSGNGLFGIGMFYAPETLLISQRSGNTGHLDGSANPLTISNKWIYTYTGKAYSDWNYIGHSTAIPPGLGFSMKGVNGTDPNIVAGRANNPGNSQRYDFRGKPNSGTISIPVSEGSATLVGNPYPSALDLSRFLWEFSGTGTYTGSCYNNFSRKNLITGIAYFWDSRDNGNSHYLNDYIGGYGAFSPVDPCTTGIYARPVFRTVEGTESGKGDHYERRFTPVAQGFMIEAVSSGTVEFRNEHRTFYREDDTFSHFKSRKITNKKSGTIKEPVIIPKIILHATIDQYYTREMILGFWHTATSMADSGMDAPAFDTAPTDIGWLIEGNNYSIDVRSLDPFEKIPLYLNVAHKATILKINVKSTENIDNQNFYIFDEETAAYHDLSDNDLEILLEPGIYHSRFKFALSRKAELTPIVNEAVDEYTVFQNNYSGELEIVNKSFAPLRGIAVYDLQGKKVFQRVRFENPAFIVISTGAWANGLYIVKLTDHKNQRVSRKITVQNK